MGYSNTATPVAPSADKRGCLVQKQVGKRFTISDDIERLAGLSDAIPAPMGRHHNPYCMYRKAKAVTETAADMGILLSKPTIITDTKSNGDPLGTRALIGWGITSPLWSALNKAAESEQKSYELWMKLSHIQTSSSVLAPSERLWECWNGESFGWLVGTDFRLKNTTHSEAKFSEWVSHCLGSLNDVFIQAQDLNFNMKSEELDPKDPAAQDKVHTILGRAWEKRIINPGAIRDVYDKWINPEHDSFKRDKSLWRLHQGYTGWTRDKQYKEASKTRLFDGDDKDTKWFNLLNEYFNLTGTEVPKETATATTGDSRDF